MKIEKSNFDKNTDIYSSKMNVLTHLQMDNKCYQEEIATLKKNKKNIKRKKKKK